MKIFSNPDKTAIRDRDDAKTNRDRLAAKLVEAEAAVIAKAAEGAALRRLDTIRAALAESEQLFATLEGQIAVTADSKQRVATNAAIERAWSTNWSRFMQLSMLRLAWFTPRSRRSIAASRMCCALRLAVRNDTHVRAADRPARAPVCIIGIIAGKL
jgi:hypothetical protein